MGWEWGGGQNAGAYSVSVKITHLKAGIAGEDDKLKNKVLMR